MQNNYFIKTKIINLLEKPHKKSNISSQIIYGEKFKILSKNKNFYKIKSHYDNYIGFVSNKINIVHKFKPTHKIKTLKSQIYFGSDKKRIKPSNKWLPFGSKLIIIKKNKKTVIIKSKLINLFITSYQVMILLEYSYPSVKQ